MSGSQMGKSWSEEGLRRIEAYRKGDTVRFDESVFRQDLASDWDRVTPVSRINPVTKPRDV